MLITDLEDGTGVSTLVDPAVPRAAAAVQQPVGVRQEQRGGSCARAWLENRLARALAVISFKAALPVQDVLRRRNGSPPPARRAQERPDEVGAGVRFTSAQAEVNPGSALTNGH